MSTPVVDPTETRPDPDVREANQAALPTKDVHDHEPVSRRLFWAFALLSMMWLVALTAEVMSNSDSAASPAPSSSSSSSGLGSEDRVEEATLAKIERIPGVESPHAIESIDGITVYEHPERPVKTSANKEITLTGWAYDGAVNRPASNVVVLFDDNEFAADYGSERKDVAKGFKDQALVPTGYTATIPATAVTPGEHSLTLAVVAADGKGYYKSNTTFKVVAS